MLTFARFTEGNELPVRLANHEDVYELRGLQPKIKELIARIRTEEESKLISARDKVLRELTDEQGYPDMHYGTTVPAIYLNEWYLVVYIPNSFLEVINAAMIVKVLTAKGTGYACIDTGATKVFYAKNPSFREYFMNMEPLINFLSKQNTGLLVDKS